MSPSGRASRNQVAPPAAAAATLSHRLLGVIAAGLLLAAAGLAVWKPDEGMWISSTARAGIVLAAIWLALPDLSRLRNGLWAAGIAVVAIVAVLRPKLLIPAVIALAALAILRPRSPGTSKPSRR